MKIYKVFSETIEIDMKIGTIYGMEYFQWVIFEFLKTSMYDHFHASNNLLRDLVECYNKYPEPTNYD